MVSGTTGREIVLQTIRRRLSVSHLKPDGKILIEKFLGEHGYELGDAFQELKIEIENVVEAPEQSEFVLLCESEEMKIDIEFNHVVQTVSFEFIFQFFFEFFSNWNHS